MSIEGLSNKNILLGVTGSIAAYKATELVRHLKKAGANIQVVMSEGAKAFVGPLTFQALTGLPVRDSLLDQDAEAAMGHIELAKWADIIVIAPASANIISDLAVGRADTLLSTLCLATPAKIIVCPAMNTNMWHSVAVQRNIKTLKSDGLVVVEPEKGEQACGDFGIGRLKEITAIAFEIEKQLYQKDWLGRHVLITLGPTREYLDPVRYITNESSGLMGLCIAKAAYLLGAKVTVISGPVNYQFPEGLDVREVINAQEMFEQVKLAVEQADVFISTAAVCDYRSQVIKTEKIKKHDNVQDFLFEKNPDILAYVGLNKLCPFVIGFAAETESLIENAKKKLIAKNLDLIVANLVGRVGNGFNSDFNQVTILGKGESEISFEKMDKQQLAFKLLNLVSEEMKKK